MAILENGTMDGLSEVGTELGDFMGNFSAGFGKFILIIAIFGGVAGIIGGVTYLIKKKVNF